MQNKITSFEIAMNVFFFLFYGAFSISPENLRSCISRKGFQVHEVRYQLLDNNFYLLSMELSFFDSLNEDSALPQLNTSHFSASYCFFPGKQTFNCVLE